MKYMGGRDKVNKIAKPVHACYCPAAHVPDI